MRKIIIFVTFFMIQSLVFSQEQEDAWVYFKDKPSSETYFLNPLTMLTQRALDRRTNQSIALDIKDVPLETSYVSAVANSSGITVKARSKWLNALHVQGTKENIDLLLNLSEVDVIDFRNKTSNKSVSIIAEKRTKFSEVKEVESLAYGMASNQITMLHGDFLHNLGFTGQGYQIAVIDAGFKGVDTFDAFSKLRDANLNNGEILGGYNFVGRSTNYYADTGSTHGLSVLSTIGAYIDAEFIGTAPDAHFYLFISEDNESETPLEESLWVEAAERADSLGVDIINTSLGYTTFDDSSDDYSYADMDGKTTFIARGAEIAASRGMVLVTSAGNEGNVTWKYISSPADAISSLTVGAVNATEDIAYFSSFGPSADNRIKPEVLAQGQNVYVVNEYGNIATSNGTSFSSPIMAGMVACLWQSFPTKTASEIKQLIKESGDLFSNPTAQKGYGIPDFESIYGNLLVHGINDVFIQVFPNPATDVVKIRIPNFTTNFEVKLYDVSGALVFSKKLFSSASEIYIDTLESGIYFMKIMLDTQVKTIKLVKK